MESNSYQYTAVASDTSTWKERVLIWLPFIHWHKCIQQGFGHPTSLFGTKLTGEQRTSGVSDCNNKGEAKNSQWKLKACWKCHVVYPLICTASQFSWMSLWPEIGHCAVYMCIFLQQYRSHTDIGNSKNYLGIQNEGDCFSDTLVLNIWFVRHQSMIFGVI